MKKLYLIVGRTCSGKSSLTKQVAKELNLNILKSYSTRAMREEELANPDSVDHVFITDEEADTILSTQTILAYTRINGIRYFATLEQVLEADFYIIDPIGVQSLERELERHGWRDQVYLETIYITAPDDVRQERYTSRGNTVAEFVERNSAENDQFAEYEEFALAGNEMALVISNKDFNEALSYFKAIVNEEVPR